MRTNPPSPLDGPRLALRRLLGDGCFIRRSRLDAFVFTTDCGRHGDRAGPMPPDKAFIRRCEGGLTHIDLSRTEWLRLIGAAPLIDLPCGDPPRERPFLYTAAVRMASAPTRPDEEDISILRFVLKSLDAGQLDSLEDRLPPMLSALRRKKAPLPRAAGLYILKYAFGLPDRTPEGEIPC